MSSATHTVAGVLTWDGLFGVAVRAAWRGAQPLHDLVPNAIRVR